MNLTALKTYKDTTKGGFKGDHKNIWLVAGGKRKRDSNLVKALEFVSKKAKRENNDFPRNRLQQRLQVTIIRAKGRAKVKQNLRRPQKSFPFLVGYS